MQHSDLAAASSGLDASATIRQMQADVFADVRLVGHCNLEMSNQLREIFQALGDVKQRGHDLKQVALEARAGAKGAALAIKEFAANTQAISDQGRISVGVVDDAENRAREALKGAALLEGSVNDISAVADVISRIAAQTKLLALNAAIEAQRAGDAGRGFAVVASEVRNLAEETRLATDQITRMIAKVRGDALNSVGEVKGFNEAVTGLRGAFTTVAAAVDQQAVTLKDIDARMAETVLMADAVDQSATELDGVGQRVTDVAAKADEVQQKTAAAMLELGDHATMLVQQNSADGTEHTRLPVILDCAIAFGAGQVSGETGDLSDEGFFFNTQTSLLDRLGEVARVEIDGIGAFRAKVIAVRSGGAECTIVDMDPGVRQRLSHLLERLKSHYDVRISRVTAFAAAISARMQQAVDTGELAQDDLFDTDYKPIPGSNPPQHMNRAVPVLERILPPILDGEMQREPRANFSVAQDMNGFVPIHNREASQPQRPDDPVWNARHCRNRRIFRDRAGLACSRNLKPYFIQYYHRDMGGGSFVPICEFNVPIYVSGKHWGGTRLSFNMTKGTGFLDA